VLEITAREDDAIGVTFLSLGTQHSVSTPCNSVPQWHVKFVSYTNGRKSTTTVRNRDETCANMFIVFTNAVSEVG